MSSGCAALWRRRMTKRPRSQPRARRSFESSGGHQPGRPGPPGWPRCPERGGDHVDHGYGSEFEDVIPFGGGDEVQTVAWQDHPSRTPANCAGAARRRLAWGVLDRLLEEPSLEIVAVSGTSAGAMNAAVL